jgi:hypothetical protein
MRGGPASPCCSSGVLQWKPFYSRLPGPGHSSASSLACWSSLLVSNQKTFTVWSQDHFLTNWSSHSQRNLKVNQNETDRIIHRSTSFRYRVSQERPRNHERKINFVFGHIRSSSDVFKSVLWIRIRIRTRRIRIR